jgi:hypothetical protein
MFLVSFTVALFLTVVLDGPPKRYQVKSLWSLLQDLVIFVMLIMILVAVIRPVFERRQLLVYHDVPLIVPLMLVLVLVMRELVIIVGHIIFQVVQSSGLCRGALQLRACGARGRQTEAAALPLHSVRRLGAYTHV